MAKKSLARKIMLSIFAGAVLLGNSVAWAACDCDLCTSSITAESITNGLKGITITDTGHGTCTFANSTLGDSATVSTILSNKYIKVNEEQANANESAKYIEAQAIGYNSIAIGDGALAGAEKVDDDNPQKNYAIAIGGDTKAITNGSIALGHHASATTEDDGIAIGYFASVSGNEEFPKVKDTIPQTHAYTLLAINKTWR